MTDSQEASGNSSRSLNIALCLAIVFYLGIGVASMWLLSPRVPYADQWVFYWNLIERNVAESVFGPVNGHREVLPGLVKLAELHWMQANQNLQILVGMLCALAAASVLIAGIWREPLNRTMRYAAIFAVMLGIFWLGNERVLAHSNEAVHAYPIILFLALGLSLLARTEPRHEQSCAWIAAACALAATFSFGSGAAVLPALLLVLLLRRAAWRSWIPVLVALFVCPALYVLGQVDATSAVMRINIGEQIILLLHWLSAPLMYVFWPLLDVQIAERLPSGLLRDGAGLVAGIWTAVFGNIRETWLPQVIVGLAGFSAFAWMSWQVFRESDAKATAQRIALGIAGFGLGVGALIALSRLEYFEQLPGQIQATRYVVWSSLFWSGLLLCGLLRLRSPRRAAVLALLVAVMVAPSQIWMGQLALSMRTAAEQVALGGLVGVLDRDEPQGETVVSDMQKVLPLLAREEVTMYAWPESRWLGRVPDASLMDELQGRDLRVSPVDNLLGGPGMRIAFSLDRHRGQRVLILDAQGIVVGIAHRHPQGYRGWIRGVAEADSLRISSLN